MKKIIFLAALTLLAFVPIQADNGTPLIEVNAYSKGEDAGGVCKVEFKMGIIHSFVGSFNIRDTEFEEHGQEGIIKKYGLKCFNESCEGTCEFGPPIPPKPEDNPAYVKLYCFCDEDDEPESESEGLPETESESESGGGGGGGENDPECTIEHEIFTSDQASTTFSFPADTDQEELNAEFARFGCTNHDCEGTCEVAISPVAPDPDEPGNSQVTITCICDESGDDGGDDEETESESEECNLVYGNGTYSNPPSTVLSFPSAWTHEQRINEFAKFSCEDVDCEGTCELALSPVRPSPNLEGYSEVTITCICLSERSEVPDLRDESSPNHIHIQNITDSELLISPNPNSGVFNVQLKTKTAGDMQLRVYDILGNVVYESSSYTLVGSYEKSIVLPKHLDNGLYHVNITIGEEQLSKKIILQK